MLTDGLEFIRDVQLDKIFMDGSWNMLRKIRRKELSSAKKW
jgi:hypothetical protein